MLYDIMTVIIITLSIMPPAMLQYYAFEPLLTERKSASSWVAMPLFYSQSFSFCSI